MFKCVMCIDVINVGIVSASLTCEQLYNKRTIRNKTCVVKRSIENIIVLSGTRTIRRVPRCHSVLW